MALELSEPGVFLSIHDPAGPDCAVVRVSPVRRQCQDLVAGRHVGSSTDGMKPIGCLLPEIIHVIGVVFVGGFRCVLAIDQGQILRVIRFGCFDVAEKPLMTIVEVT